MTRENVKMNMDIISAFAEGKIIQYKTVTGSWCDLTEDEGLPMGTLEEEPNNFRIKPEPKYRPFGNAEECWTEMLKHQPFGWIRNKFNTDGVITGIVFLDSRKGFKIHTEFSQGNTSEDMINAFVFADGTPFGVKVE